MDQKAFLEKLKKLQEKEGVSLEAIITVKKEIAEGMTSREKTLVEHIVQTYLTAKFQVNEVEEDPKAMKKE